MSASKWHPDVGDDGLWRPTSDAGQVVNVGFETAGQCMAYLVRSGLVSAGPSLAKARPFIDMAKRLPADEVRRFMDAWNKRQDKIVILPDDNRIPEILADAAREDAMPDDDRWEWVNVATMGDAGPVWTKGECRHKTPEPVDAYPSRELVAWLCVDCGQTFEADRWPVPEGMWRRIPFLWDDEDAPSGSLHKIDGQPVIRQDDDLKDHPVWTGLVTVWERMKRNIAMQPYLIIVMIGAWYLIGVDLDWW